MSRNRIASTLAILAALLLLITAVSTQAQQAEPQAPEAIAAEKPEILVEEPFREWTVGGNFIYWANRCSGAPGAPEPEAAEEVYHLRRLPIGRGMARTLVTATAADCVTFLNMAADAAGVTYFSQSGGQIVMIPAGAGPEVKPLVLQTGVDDVEAGLVLDDVYLFYANQDGEIIRVARDGSGATTLFTGGLAIKDLAVDGASIYWIDSEGLWWAPKNCASPPCTGTRLSSQTGEFLTVDGEAIGGQPAAVLLVQSGSRGRIRRMACAVQQGGPPLCGLSDYYESAVGTAIGTVSRVESGSFFDRDVWLFWTEVSSTSSRLMRLLVSEENQPAEELYPGSPTLSFKNFADPDYIYIADRATGAEQIMRLTQGADPLERDLAFAQWEVTQGVQNLVHDVTLVAHKPTYVRVFGRQLSGQRAGTVEAALRGYRDGQELPESPLQPIRNATQALLSNETYERADDGQGWLFRVPESWTGAGTTTLRAEIDPRGLYADGDPDNNWNQGPVTFAPSRRACAIFIPVLTDDPLPYAIGNPHFLPVVDRVKNLWPLAGIVSYQQSSPLKENGGPFEMDDDAAKVLGAVEERWMTGNVPPGCPQNSRYFAVGMVHSYATGSVRGSGYTGTNEVASWVEIPDPERWYDTQAVHYPAVTVSAGFGAYYISYGTILAHELAHNTGRAHVNCGLPEDADYDTQWPYPGSECQLDDHDPDSPNSHFGLQTRLLQLIPGSEAADIMTYDYEPTWISDYTSNGIYQALCPSAAACSTGQNGPAPSTGGAVHAGPILLVTGLVDSGSGAGTLGRAWLFGEESVSPEVARRWQARRAAQAANTPEVEIVLKLLAADGSLLASQNVTPDVVADSPPGAEQPFLTPILAANHDIAALELWIDGQLADRLAPGSAPPQVSISQPVAGQTVGDSVSGAWSIADPDGDAVSFLVQYSPDGLFWFTVAGPLPAREGPMAQPLDLGALPGSQANGAQVRIVATDGLHTTFVNSAAFTVEDQAPQVMLGAPGPGQQVAPSEPVSLRGEAVDPEDGPLAGTDLIWRLNGGQLGPGSEMMLDGLAPGEYQAELIATDSAGNQGQATVDFTVAPLTIPDGPAPLLDGTCDEAGYSGSAQVLLAAYLEGERATVRAHRQGDYFWACFSGLRRSSGSSPTRAGVRLDPDYSRDPLGQPDDYSFFVSEDGTIEVLVGDGAGGAQSADVTGISALVSATDGGWQAEMRLPLALFQGWNHVAGLAFMHEEPGVAHYSWPKWIDEVGRLEPASWATTALGARPQLSGANPAAAKAGSPDLTLTLEGQGFAEGAEVWWNDTPLATTFVDESTLEAEVAAAALAQGATVFLRVANPGFGAAPSAALAFDVENPVPLLASLSPQTAVAGSGALQLQVTGSNFLPGVQLLWNGQPLATERVNGGQLRVEVPADALGMPGPVSVVVYQPAPGGGSSVAQEFVVLPAGEAAAGQRLFLPAIIREGTVGLGQHGR